MRKQTFNHLNELNKQEIADICFLAIYVHKNIFNNLARAASVHVVQLVLHEKVSLIHHVITGCLLTAVIAKS